MSAQGTSLARGSFCTSFCEASQPGPQALEPPDQPHCSPWKPVCALGFPPRLPQQLLIPHPPMSLLLPLPALRSGCLPASTSLHQPGSSPQSARGTDGSGAGAFLCPRVEQGPRGRVSGGVGRRLWKESVQVSRSVISDSVTPWTAAHQASLSITNSWSLLFWKEYS